jgi:hypothetical protein
MPHRRQRTAYCQEQAAECAKAAVSSTIAEVKEAYLNLEQGWLQLAPEVADTSVPERSTHRLEQAVARLKSLHDGDAAVVDVIACGKEAIPAVRVILFERERSGLFQTRCRAVEALAGLGAYDILVEYLNADRPPGDAVEELGNDAVINAAAIAAAKTREERVFHLLMRLSERPSLTGVVRALGSFDRHEAIPRLISALEEDASRSTAEAALKRIGKGARDALVAAAQFRSPSDEQENESSLRRRRSALRLMAEIGMPSKLRPRLRSLVWDRDAEVSVLACQMCLANSLAEETAIRRLNALLPDVHWMLRSEIEHLLSTHRQKR